MNAMVSRITSLTVVYSTVYSGADQRKHQSPASLAFVREIHRWPVNSPHKGHVTRKMSPFDDVIMETGFRGISSCDQPSDWECETVYLETGFPWIISCDLSTLIRSLSHQTQRESHASVRKRNLCCDSTWHYFRDFINTRLHVVGCQYVMVMPVFIISECGLVTPCDVIYFSKCWFR